jgi:hypothetical protein
MMMLDSTTISPSFTSTGNHPSGHNDVRFSDTLQHVQCRYDKVRPFSNNAISTLGCFKKSCGAQPRVWS